MIRKEDKNNRIFIDPTVEKNQLLQELNTFKRNIQKKKGNKHKK